MREIKFRGWHTISKIMFSAEEMATDQLTLLPTGSFINVSGDSTRLSVIYPNDKFIPLQYTGLKDKNNKEIYEGDIVRATGDYQEYSENWEVVYCGEKDYPAFDLKGHPFVDCNTLSYYMAQGSLEVIGNIYENSELLERIG